MDENEQNVPIDSGEQKKDTAGVSTFNNKSLIVGAIVLILLIAAAVIYFSYSKNKTLPPNLNNASNQTAPARTESGATESTINSTNADVKSITVDGDEFSYMPSTINLNVGQTVSLTFRNTGRLPHNLTIDELGVETKTISPGESDTVEFTVDKSGTYAYYCSVDSHRGRGMEGEIIVSP